MTYFYRCQFCASHKDRSAKVSRDHLYKRHRERLIRGLGLIETFGTHQGATQPSTPLRTRQDVNIGTTGEGDST